MPHMRIEYSPGLARRVDMDALCGCVHEAMVASGIFPLAGIRIRAFAADHCIVADGHPDNAFAACTLTVGAGRSTETLNAAGALIFGALQTFLAELLAQPHFALSLDIRVSDPELSWKDTPIHARLSKKA